MTYQEYYQILQKYQMVTPIWYEITKLLDDVVKHQKKDDYLKVFLMYFSFICDGNLCMVLDENKLKAKWEQKINETQILFMDKKGYNEQDLINLKEETNNLYQLLDEINCEELSEIIGFNKLFTIDKKEILPEKSCERWLYTKKYNDGRIMVSNWIDELFHGSFKAKNEFNYKDISIDSFSLTEGQASAITIGRNKNLLITGGPGTGKTTSILFLLISLLKENPNAFVYMTAPSGKAAKRMKNSIQNSMVFLKEDFVNENQDIINKIKSLEGRTIHSLLGVTNNGFVHNSDNQFDVNSIFVIDEASMIDVTIFSALLQSIPVGARVFIMGDKDQLPSVECGAVFGDLLKIMPNNVVELNESKRFTKDTIIYDIARIINEGSDLPEITWNNYQEFKIESKNSKKPIYYYLDNDASDDEIIKHISSIWTKEYYLDLINLCTNIECDKETFRKIIKKSEEAKILCAENDGPRGIKNINRIVKHLCVGQKYQNVLYYPGQILMINSNIKELDLNNGDCGIIVKFINDDTLYFMIEQNNNQYIDGKVDYKIFKLGDYMFYPISFIPSDAIDMAYAITIHKSQGSDYENILVVLPKRKGHPLLNRQIIYTAITRTKGNTYIISNNERLCEAKDHLLSRDTNLIKRRTTNEC